MPHTNPIPNPFQDHRLRLAHEAGWFAGERSRRRRGGRGWSRDDWAAAHRAFEAAMGEPSGGEPADEHERRHGLADVPLQPLTADQTARLRKALAESPAVPDNSGLVDTILNLPDDGSVRK